jgi:hypothetical protein
VLRSGWHRRPHWPVALLATCGGRSLRRKPDRRKLDVARSEIYSTSSDRPDALARIELNVIRRQDNYYRGYQPEKADRPIVRDFEAIVRS